MFRSIDGCAVAGWLAGDYPEAPQFVGTILAHSAATSGDLERQGATLTY